MKDNKFTPTDAIKNNSLRGRALFQKAKSVAHSVMLQKVEPLVKSLDGDLSLDQVKELYTFLNKAKDTYRPTRRVEKGVMDAESTSFLAAGGTSALYWCKMILKQEGILKSSTEEISNKQISTEETYPDIKLQVSKAVNEDLMQATFVVMVPDEVDLHGDITSEEEVRKACHNFNKFCQTANLFHLVKTDSFEFAESYIAPTDFVLGDKFVKKGTWLCTIQCLDEQLWQLIKSGEICSVSIGALASVSKLEEE